MPAQCSLVCSFPPRDLMGRTSSDMSSARDTTRVNSNASGNNPWPVCAYVPIVFQLPSNNNTPPAESAIQQLTCRPFPSTSTTPSPPPKPRKQQQGRQPVLLLLLRLRVYQRLRHSRRIRLCILRRNLALRPSQRLHHTFLARSHSLRARLPYQEQVMVRQRHSRALCLLNQVKYRLRPSQER